MQWKFTLTDTTFGTPITEQVVEPNGWNGIKFIFKRDLKLHGVFFETTLKELTFYNTQDAGLNGGYDLLYDAYHEKGISASTTLLIAVQCEEGGTFDTFFEGQINYAKYKEIKGDACGISVGIEQTGCLQEFITRLDQNVNLESLVGFDETTALTPYSGLGFETELPEKDIVFAAEVNMPAHYTLQYTDSILYPQVTGTRANYFFNLSFSDVVNDDLELNNFECEGAGIANPVAFEFTDFADQCVGILAPTKEILCEDGDYSIGIRLKGVITEFSLDSRIYEVDFVMRSGNAGDGWANVTNLFSQGAAPSGGSTETIPFDITVSPTSFPLTTGVDSFYIYFLIRTYRYTTGSPSDPFQMTVDFEIGQLTARTFSFCPATQGKVFLINESLSRTLEIITSDCMRVYSDYYGRRDAEPYQSALNGCGSNRYITNGLLVRNAELISGAEPQMSVSFKKLFDSLNAIDNIGLGIQADPNRTGYNMIRIEPVEHFYEPTEVVACEEVKDLEITVDETRVFSKIRVGYKKWEPEDTGGLDDIHSKREYRTEQGVVVNELNIESDFIASNYALEVTRRQGATTKDFKYDNDIFIVCYLYIYGNYDARLDFFPSTGNNLVALFYYNQRISPVRNLMHWFKSISPTWSYEFLTQVKKLHFTSGDANYVAGWQKTSDDDCLLEDQTSLLYENQDISKIDFKDYDECKPIWEPETIDFEYPLSYSDFRALRRYPYRKVRVTQGVNEWFGWIINLEYDPNAGMAKWTLLRVYENNY